MSIIQKIFVIVMNGRLTEFCLEYNKIEDAQGAYQRKKGAEEFLLEFNILLHHSLRENDGPVIVGQLDL